jgi:outer membrane protein, multidrug efflux system
MKKLALLPVLTLLAGCTVGPNYKRPTVNVPTDYRGVMPAQPATVASLGNEKWWDVYQDPVLTQLIHTALQSIRQSKPWFTGLQREWRLISGFVRPR